MFPGPELRCAFAFPRYYELLSGDEAKNWHELHLRYGDVVRVAPHMISIIHPDAWRGMQHHELRLELS